MGSERATCWSITINNPSEEEVKPTLPAGWSLTGQMEAGEEKGTEHYQGMLTTPQTRFSAVKRVFPRAHIEVAKNRTALAKYVHKADTRIAEVADHTSNIPTLFNYQHEVAGKWNDEDWREHLDRHLAENPKMDVGEIAILYVDTLVAMDIEDGRCGVEFIAINPMWRSAWKRFWRQMVKRERLALQTQQDEVPIAGSAEQDD